MIQVLHFADTHIGMENYGKTDPTTGLSSRVVDFLRRLDTMCDYAAQHDVDLIIFAGDAFKTRTPNPTYQREFAHRIRDLSQLAPVVLLVGNHDVAPARMKASSIEIYDTLAVPNVWVADEYEVRRITTKRGDVVVGTAPYPIRSRVLENIKTMGLTIAETDNILEEQLIHILESLAQEADTYGETPRLLTGHFTVSGALLGSERGIMLGRDVNVPRGVLADSRWDYVALGHIHKHQSLNHDDMPPIVYSGSIERIDFGEEGDLKGFCWVELARGKTRWQFIPLSARPFVTLKLDLRDNPYPTQTVIEEIQDHDLEDAIVRLQLSFSAESEAKFNEIAVRDALKQAKAFFIAAIKKEVEQTTRARLGVSPEGLTPIELLEKYLISLETPADRRAELLELAQEIMDETNTE
ncbi:MAG: exonuclease SbcCD subunit D [Chloroflexi bacterium]|nr:MAG: exonuclease SbcCD subunit D [Chloroflexota bacterium]